MYRALALAAIRAGINLRDEDALAQLASRTKIDFVPGEQPRVLLNGEDVSSLIRTPEVSMAASDVSTVPAVRRALVRLQQDLGRRSGGVLEGRDIGTKVFPETPFKFFLTARPEVRARRRYDQLLTTGTRAGYDTVLAETRLRDQQDSTRTDSPLTHDQTYSVIDTSDLSIDEVVNAIVRSVRKGG
jgi:cytidylate kinase